MSLPVPGHNRRIYRAGTRRARIGCRCGRGAGQGRQTARCAGASDRGDDWRRHRLQRHHAAADPALDRQPQGASGLVGQAAAVPDRDRRPAQQPADRDHTRQAHRVGIPVAQPEALSRQRRRELLGRRPTARGQRGRQLRRAHRRLRKQGHHLDLRRARHARQQGQPAELPRRRAPAGRRHVPDRRHPQLPRADHRPQGQQDRHPVGGARQVPPRPAQATRAPERRHADGERRHPGQRDHRGLDLAHHAPGPVAVERARAACALSVRRLPDGGRQAGHRGRFQQARPGRDLRPGDRQAELGVLRRRGREDARPSVAGARAARHRRHPRRRRPARPRRRDRPQDQGVHLAIRRDRREGPRAGLS